MGTTYKELFKLYDLIQSGDEGLVVRFLEQNSVDLNSILPCKGIGVLHLAVGIEPLEKSKKCTEIILKHGADPNLSNDDGITPVHIAAIWGRVDNLKLLLGCGGDPSKCDFEGISAFDYAVREQQWDVYDYLHNVVDQSDDSTGSQCAYTLGLERILVTTDQMVAEYEPVDENQNNPSLTRKSDMIRDWCDKNNLVINRLYPTILGDTYLIENESEPWKNNDFTKYSIDTKHNLNETANTFKTCVSRDSEIDISGVRPLELTVDKSQCSTNIIRRESVYENFSLPGSPNSIVHKNYKTKTCLKKSKMQSANSLSLEMNKWSLKDTPVDMDRALAMAQNKTNEWLCSCSDISEVRPGNTRRSSASSGVSSNFAGSIVLANIQEEYKYEDKEEDVVLIERRMLVPSVVLPVEDSADSPDQTIASVASSLPPTMEYDNNTLRTDLIRLGFTPGPIQENTKMLYLKKLQALKKNPIVAQHRNKTYSVELEKSLRSDDWMNNLSPYVELENLTKLDFTKQDKKWREGNAKTSFTYLLLDPRVTNNLPSKRNNNPHASWRTFINSIFYIGKGKRSRPYSHLYQALSLWKKNFKQSGDKKVQHILDIWSEKLGVICLHVFQNVIPAEAYTYEAAMIDVIGVPNLKNLKTGNYYGVASSWPHKDRRMLGLYLLYKAMQIFLCEGERQLGPDDICTDV